MISTHRIKDQMNSKGITFIRLAKDLNVTTMCAYNWVDKPHNLSMIKIDRLAKAIKVGRGQLIDWILEAM